MESSHRSGQDERSASSDVEAGETDYKHQDALFHPRSANSSTIICSFLDYLLHDAVAGVTGELHSFWWIFVTGKTLENDRYNSLSLFQRMQKMICSQDIMCTSILSTWQISSCSCG